MPKFIPYGRQSISDEDIQAVTAVLQSDWLTTGPKIEEFEKALADFVGADHAVAVCNGTAALHAAVYAAGIGPSHEVIVPPMTFAASANAVVFQGARPIFCDVRQDNLLIDPALVEATITPRTKALIGVDYAGHPCDADALRTIAETHNLTYIADACHAIGGAYRGRAVGSLADLSTFSFHPVKHFTTGEGGMITTDNAELAGRMRLFRNHGIRTDHRQRSKLGTWFYEMVDLGYNYRITDFQCALGLSQLTRLGEWVRRRQAIARRYDEAFADLAGIEPLRTHHDVSHAYHLYVVRLAGPAATKRGDVFAALRQAGVGVNVHYIPVHLHPFYRERFGTGPGLCPVAEAAYEQIISLPMFPAMSDQDVQGVITACRTCLDQL